MPRSNLPPDNFSEIDGILRRLERVERNLGSEQITRLRKLADVADRATLDDGDVPTWTGAKFELMPGSGGGATGVVFSYPGTVFTNIESPPWYPSDTMTLTHARLSTLATSASNIVVDVRKNGSVAATLTLTAGNLTTTSTVSVAVGTSDYLTVKVTSVGSDADNITVILDV